MIIFNEQLHAENLIKNTYKRTSVYTNDLSYLSKYYKYKDYSDQEIKNLLYEYCNKFVKFNIDVEYKKINTALKNINKYKLKITSDIYLTANELDIITSEKNITVQKILFICICLCRYYNTNYIKLLDKTKLTFTSLFLLAGYKMSKKELNKTIFYIYKKKYWEELRGVDNTIIAGSYKINILDASEDAVHAITFMPTNEMVINYEKYLSDRIIQCAKCGTTIK